MENDEVKKNFLHKILIILIVLLLTRGAQLFAQSTGGEGAGEASSKFKQRIEWSADKNAFEYKVEIRSDGNIVQTFNTSDNFVNLNLPAGSYDYRVTVYDFLGREQDVSAWQKFEISKANAPAFSNVEESFEVDTGSADKVVLPVEVDNVAEGASVALVNVKTGESIAGSLLLSAGAAGLAAGKSEIASATAEFPKISDGEWKLVVTNPSGLTSESPAIAIKTVDKEKERKAAEKAAEKAAKEAAALAEKEEKEKQEKQKTVAKGLKTSNMYILAEDDEEDEEEEEEEDVFEEVAEILEPEKPEEPDVLEPLEEVSEAEKPKRKPYKPLGIEVKAGAGLAANLFDSDLLSLKNYDPIIEAMPDNLTLDLLAAISYIPNFDWRIKPGIELSVSAFTYHYRSPAFGKMEWEYMQFFTYNNVQLTLIGQVSLLPQIIFLNVKAGGGVTAIKLTNKYTNNRPDSVRAFTYPKMNAGLSFEFIPIKFLVIEVGGDYNRILSDKVNFSYLMPYLEVGVRF
jgi:hypothetical protein